MDMINLLIWIKIEQLPLLIEILAYGVKDGWSE